MKAYDFVHLLLYASGGQIQGRTKLQKTAYFVSKLSGLPEEAAYHAHFYGPYSPSIAGAVEQLRGLGFLQQHVAGGGAIDPQGFEVSRFDYVLTDDGRRIASEKTTRFPEEWKTIQSAVETVRGAGPNDYVKLSIAAKAFFLAEGAKRPVTDEDLSKMSERFGWKVTQEQFNEATNFLRSLKLVKNRPSTV